MYANAPHASVAHQVTLPPQQLPQAQPGTLGVPAHAQPPAHAAPAPMQAAAPVAPAAQHRDVGAAYVTGAYQSVGDPAIDRMVRLEAACKRFGSPF